jgi:hypothetical protein
MMTLERSQEQDAPEVAAFVQGLIEDAARLRLPELFTGDHPEALYYLPDRNGVGVIALPTTALSEDQLIAIMKYRLAQYLAVNFVDARMVYEARMAYEPLAGVSPHDVHVIAGSTVSGEILCYMAIMAPDEVRRGTTLREQERHLFPVEKAHGWGVYNRLRVLPDLPVTKLREIGRFVKNQRLNSFDELAVRAPVEVFVAACRMLTGSLRLEVDAIIGDIEENVVKQNLDYFHLPLIIIHGTVVHVSETSYKYPMYLHRNHYPFAILVSDMSRALERWDIIEQALTLPGKRALAALLALRRDMPAYTSSLEPSEGLAPLTDTDLPERRAAMPVRRRLLDAGERLRATDLLRSLTIGEATVLGTLMERCEAAAGDVIIRQGEIGDALFVIESGQAEVRIRGHAGRSEVLATCGPGDYVGEIALLTGGAGTADVVAMTPMILMKLSKDVYTRYLSHVVEVERQISRTATTRADQTLRKTMMGNAVTVAGVRSLHHHDSLRDRLAG